MSRIKNTILIGDDEITISHRDCREPSEYEREKFYFSFKSDLNDTLTEIVLNDSFSIYIHWEAHTSTLPVSVFYVSETGVMFVGCGTYSIQISVKEERLIDLKNVALFWGLSRYKEYIVESGELECFLYSLDGILLDRTAVDPPYESEYSERGIKYESIVSGTTWLKFPSKT